MRKSGWFAIAWLLSIAAFAASPIILTVDTSGFGYSVPPDFAGVSIFAGTQVANHRDVPGNLFSATNAQLITLFRNSGIHHLRLGATGSSSSSARNLEHSDIDSLFGFAKAADIRVIYSLHAINAAETAQYIWTNYRLWLDCFAFDNEPDGPVKNGPAPESAFANFLADWRNVITTVRMAVPEAKFAGPDAAGRSLAPVFARREKDTGCLTLITQHTYIGGNSLKHHIDPPQAMDAMLSKEWATNQYPRLYQTALLPVVNMGFPFRITELDDYVHGVTNASDAFCSALWALDCMHWWAARGAAGINFQNTEWLPTDTFYRDSFGNYQVHPKAYAIKAFDLGSHGHCEPVEIRNGDGLNLTAYAIGDGTNICLSIINKEHGGKGRNARVTINFKNFPLSRASAIFLSAPQGNAGAVDGITLGGEPFANNTPWQGKWTLLPLTSSNQCMLDVPSTSAAVVKVASHY